MIIEKRNAKPPLPNPTWRESRDAMVISESLVSVFSNSHSFYTLIFDKFIRKSLQWTQKYLDKIISMNTINKLYSVVNSYMYSIYLK